MEMGQTRSRRDQQRRHKNEKLSIKKHKVAARRKVKFQLQKHTLPKCVMRIGLDTQSSILTHTHTFTLYNYPGHHSGEGTMSAATFLIQMRPGTTDASLLPPVTLPPHYHLLLSRIIQNAGHNAGVIRKWKNPSAVENAEDV